MRILLLIAEMRECRLHDEEEDDDDDLFYSNKGPPIHFFCPLHNTRSVDWVKFGSLSSDMGSSFLILLYYFNN